MDNKGYAMEHQQGYPGAYGQAAYAAPQVVVQPNSQIQTVTVQTTERWRWCTLVTSVISVFLCACCGLPAMVAAIMAYSDHKVKDYPRAHNKFRFALGCGITGIVIGVIWIIACIAVYAAATITLLGYNMST